MASRSSWDEYFLSRKWRVLAEADGLREVGGVPVIFKAGHFEVGGEGVFQSPLSFNKGRRGVLLQEVADGADVPCSVIPIGEKILPRVRAAGALV